MTNADAANPFGPLAEQMETLSAPMPENDGVRGFNGLYRAVTRAVGTEFEEQPFEDPVFFSKLAPAFAGLYSTPSRPRTPSTSPRGCGSRCSRSASSRTSRRCSSRSPG